MLLNDRLSGSDGWGAQPAQLDPVLFLIGPSPRAWQALLRRMLAAVRVRMVHVAAIDSVREFPGPCVLLHYVVPQDQKPAEIGNLHLGARCGQIIVSPEATPQAECYWRELGAIDVGRPTFAFAGQVVKTVQRYFARYGARDQLVLPAEWHASSEPSSKQA